METWLGKFLIAAGIFCVVSGVVLLVAPKVPWLGKLPGDIRFQGERFSFHFPLMTCLLVSILLTLLFNLFLRR